ncbi:GNAT family N-acetyltransferase [Gaoshiqia sediminis]|uniref:GNAT family N-acetyltransferase n=1 Tax=Gaoshiqia sediminis TaxID=2986998 RepID=A0AA42C8H4_9BACT|nr:GNAT family N-acetyltransferase [Gaoshiqia sediminis]MCW0482716.1 GNAT family N-acetyltransferase [Gaoshiqia sediminis]
MNNNVQIRLATPDDAPEILAIYYPYILDTAVTFEEEVPSLDEFRQRINSILEECPFLVCEIGGQLAGYAYAGPYRTRASYRWNKEVSVYVHDAFQRKQVARALYLALFELLARQHVANLLAVITLPNEGSVRLHEQMGFKPCGVFNRVGFKLGQWHSVGWWELSLPEADKSNPAELIPFGTFRENHSLDEIFQKAASLVKIS